MMISSFGSPLYDEFFRHVLPRKHEQKHIAEPSFFSIPGLVTLDHDNQSSSKFMFESMRSEYIFDKNFSLIQGGNS